tara:strand:- start:1223 stop:1513 length:291 start_codon:yes stop_codon:yes gene_type:complete
MTHTTPWIERIFRQMNADSATREMNASSEPKEDEVSVFQSSRDAENAAQLSADMNTEFRYDVVECPYGGYWVAVFDRQNKSYIGYLRVPENLTKTA